MLVVFEGSLLRVTMNKQFVSELLALLEKWDCAIDFSCAGDTYGICCEELSMRRGSEALVSTKDISGSMGWSITAGDLRNLLKTT